MRAGDGDVIVASTVTQLNFEDTKNCAAIFVISNEMHEQQPFVSCAYFQLSGRLFVDLRVSVESHTIGECRCCSR